MLLHKVKLILKRNVVNIELVFFKHRAVGAVRGSTTGGAIVLDNCCVEH